MTAIVTAQPADADETSPEAPLSKRGEHENPYGKDALPFKKAALLAILSGVFYWAAFPGIDVWPFAFVCWAPLLVAMRGQTPRRALLLGLLQGLTCNLLGFYWLLTMLKTFSGFPLPLCALFMVILCAYQGGRMSLMAYLYSRAERKGWPVATVFILAFIGHEMLYPLLFPWYTGAQTHKVPLLMQTAELGGPIMIGVLLAGGSIALAELAWSRMDQRPIDRRRVGIALAGPVFMLIYGAIRLPMVDKQMESAEKARVGVVQGNLPLMSHEHKDTAAIHRNATDKLEQQGKLDLVVWSETAINFLIPEEFLGQSLDRIVMHGPNGVNIDTPVLTGVIIRRGSLLDRKKSKIYNSAVLVHPDGKIEGVYDKTYLLAFGEYIPFGETFPSLYEISKNSGNLTPGTSLAPIPFGKHKITTLICYEDILPSFTNKIVRYGDPDLLVNATNDAWFGKSTEPAIHLALAKFRAVEHRRFLIRATNSGVSAFIDANGRSWGETPLFEEAAAVSDVRWMRSRTPYELWGDIPWWIASLAVVAMGFWKRPAGGREAKA
jgi:apolipoprotein N-acyltransferase